MCEASQFWIWYLCSQYLYSYMVNNYIIRWLSGQNRLCHVYPLVLSFVIQRRSLYIIPNQSFVKHWFNIDIWGQVQNKTMDCSVVVVFHFPFFPWSRASKMHRKWQNPVLVRTEISVEERGKAKLWNCKSFRNLTELRNRELISLFQEMVAKKMWWKKNCIVRFWYCWSPTILWYILCFGHVTGTGGFKWGQLRESLQYP